MWSNCVAHSINRKMHSICTLQMCVCVCMCLHVACESVDRACVCLHVVGLRMLYIHILYVNVCACVRVCVCTCLLHLFIYTHDMHACVYACVRVFPSTDVSASDLAAALMPVDDEGLEDTVKATAAIVFVSTIYTAQFVTEVLSEMGILCVCLHRCVYMCVRFE